MSPPSVQKGQNNSRAGDDGPGHQPTSHSWKVHSGQAAVKRMDRSSFVHHEMAIPVGIRPFFNIDTMQVGEKRRAELVHGVIEYQAYFEMLNEENPRTRLVWKSDLQRLIQEKFPDWAAFFENHTKPPGTTPPDLKIVKTRLGSKYLLFLEHTRKSSETLDLLKVYSREELKSGFGVTDAIIRYGIFKPGDAPSIWLFVTGEALPDGSGPRHHFDEQVLQFEGKARRKADPLIVDHERDGNEIVVFYRHRRREFASYGYRYLGRFSYLSHIAGKLIDEPSRFILYPIDVMTGAGGGLVAVGSSHPPVPEGSEQACIQTRYERDPRLRKQAIISHGTTCAECGFDFAERYGRYGEGYIEIHCKKPHASIRDWKDVDPAADLVPLCSNCHRMVHRADPVLLVGDLKKMLE